MDYWSGKIVIVTGASSGIGASIVKELIKYEMIIIGLARRHEKMIQLRDELAQDLRENFHPVKCDISKLDSIKNAFKEIGEKFKTVHVLINNAGIMSSNGILDEGNEHELKKIVDTNLMGNVFCLKEAYKLMKKSKEDGGDEDVRHIIMMNSILGHSVPVIPGIPLTYGLYPSTKFGLRGLSQVLAQELMKEKHFRISTVSPGLVRTDICHSANNCSADIIMQSKAILNPEDIAQAVTFILSVPKHVQISEIIINPTRQKF